MIQEEANLSINLSQSNHAENLLTGDSSEELRMKGRLEEKKKHALDGKA